MPINTWIKKISLVLVIGVVLILPFAAFVQAQGIVEAVTNPIGTVAGVVATAVTGEPSQASCGIDVFCYMSKFFNWASLSIGQLISYVAGAFIALAVGFIQLLINLGSQVMASPLVTEGFKISLNIANLGFVLAIIVIAYTTIFRIAGYETKALLQKLIVAALLINFSFAIAGVVIDFNNVFGNFFISAVSGGDIGAFGNNLANSLSIQKLSGVMPGTAQGIIGGEMLKAGVSFLAAFTSVAAIAIFNVTLQIALFALVFMLLVRYLIITFLLVVMPIAWLSWVFPKMGHIWSEWWSTFFKWNFFFPAVSFFLYLSILASQKIGQLIASGSANSAALATADTFMGVASNTAVGFIQIFVQVGILIGGLMMAQRMGIKGADGAMKMIGSAKNMIIGATGKVAGLPLRAAGGVGAMAGSRVANKLLEKGGLAEKFASKVQGVPILGRVAPGIYNLVASRQQAVASQQKDVLAKDSNDALLAKFNTFTTDKVQRAALVSEVVKRGMDTKVDSKRLDAYLEDAKDMGATRDILDSAPHYAGRVANLAEMQKKDPAAAITEENYQENAIEAAMDKFKPGKTDSLSPDAIEKLARYFRKGHRERLAKEGSIDQLRAVEKIAEKLINEGKENDPLVESARNNPSLQRVVIKPAPAAKPSIIEAIETKRKEGPNVGFKA